MAQKILFIDDEKDAVEFQKSYFSRRGYTVLSAGSTQEALEAIKNEALDLAFCDLKLESNTSGLDILKEAKGLKPNLPIYIITGYLDKDVEDKALALGAKEVLHKPFPLPELEQKIKATLSVF